VPCRIEEIQMSVPDQSVAMVEYYLRRSSFFGHLPGQVLDRIARAGRRRQFAKGDEIIRRGEHGDSALLVLRGHLKVANATVNGRELVLNFLTTGDIVGEIALLDGRERTATVSALEAGEVFVIRREEFRPLLLDHPQALLELVELLCEKLRHATAIIEDSAHEMSSRMARGLARIARQHGHSVGGSIHIDLQLTQTELGNYVGLSRANVNRQLGQLKAAGIADQNGRHIIIFDAERLNALAEGP
jgi:CRP/FNR family transcriptional regulator, cyclic AMP receptor protein